VRERPARTRLLVPLAALLLLPAVLAGCGSSDNSSAEATWAQGFCSALGTWKTSVETAGKTLADVKNLSKTTAEQSVTDISDANAKLVDDLNALGKPPGSAAPEAKATLQDLGTQLKHSADQVKAAMKGVTSPQDLLTAVSAMATTASATATAVSETITKLESLDASDKWKQAFDDSDACTSLKNR
jgi:polyhydroxyalkanoate synthesis regulator phasin